MGARTFTLTGIVLKRHNTGETDRIVTLLSQEFGKITCVAKGVRNLQSSKRAYLEPGNLVKAFCVATASLPLLTQAVLISDAGACRESLKKVRQMHQFLEVVDQLFVEEELGSAFFADILDLRETVLTAKSSVGAIRSKFERILVQLGYHNSETSIDSILTKVSEVTQRPVHSYEYLVVKPQ